MSLLTQWSGGFHTTKFNVSDDIEMETLNRAFRVQMRIGVRNLSRELLAQEIIELQRWYYDSHKHKKKNNILRWSHEVVKFLITMAADSWKQDVKSLTKKIKN